VSLFLSSLPLWISVLVIVVVPTILAMSGPLLVRRVLGLDELVTYNEVAGFKFAVVGVTYAVLLGFAVIVVWEKFRDAEATVAQEASAVVAVHRLSEGLSADVGAGIRQHLNDYVQAVIADDWPAMARAKVSRQASRTLDGLYAAVLSFNPTTPRESAIMSELITRIDAITQARRTRFLLATGTVPAVLWATLSIGAMANLSFTFFFGLQSIRAQTLMTGLLALIIFMTFFVAVAIDHPFTGEVSVGPEALQSALDTFGDNH
jgi:hypothetical protein